MKILYLTNIPSPYRVDFFNELGKYCELKVLFERETAGDRDQRWKADRFENFRAIFLTGIKVGADASISLSVLPYLKKGYDAIILGGYSSPTYMLAIDYMKTHKIPFFINADGGFIKKNNSFIRRLKTHYIGAAQGWLSTGKMTDQYLLYYGAQKEKIYHYPFTSIKESDLCYPTNEEKSHIKELLKIREKKIALTVGRFIEIKGFEFLIEAAGKMNKDYGVYIVGGIPDKKYLEIVQQYEAINVHFIDFMDKIQLKKYYMAADIFVFTSKLDVWGLVLNEAMSCGLPCIASSMANASYELIDEGINGYVVNPEDIQELAHKMENLLTNDTMREEMGISALGKIKNFTIEEMAKAHITIIESWNKSRKG